MAEKTEDPQLFELYYKTAQVYGALIKSIKELAKAYQKELVQAETFSINEWIRLKRLENAANMYKQDAEKSNEDCIFLINLFMKQTNGRI
jgi:hypothetical protein